MTEPETSSSSSSMTMTLDSSSLLADSVSKLLLSPSSTAKMALLKPDWSLLPEELLLLISTHLEKQNCCFFVDFIHARSVCNSWRSTFPFPCCLRQNYSLPTNPRERPGLCTLEKIPLFLYRVQTQTPPYEYFIGGISRQDHHMELHSPRQCSVKVNRRGSYPTVMKMLDSHIIPLGHYYRLFSSNPKYRRRLGKYEVMAFIPLNKEGGEGGEGEGFVVLLNYSTFMLVLRSFEMKWIWIKNYFNDSSDYLSAFKGKFYALLYAGDIFVIDPFSLEKTLVKEKTTLMVPQDLKWSKYLVSCGNEELFMIEKWSDVFVDWRRFACRVSRLDEKTGEWIAVSDLGDRVLFIGPLGLGNFACSGKKLPDGCGFTGNSILFDEPGGLTSVYKYVEDDDLSFWRLSIQNHALFISKKCPPVLALRVDKRASPNVI